MEQSFLHGSFQQAYFIKGYEEKKRVCEEKSVIKIFYDNDWG